MIHDFILSTEAKTEFRDNNNGIFKKYIYSLVCIFYHYFALGCYNSTDKSTGHGISCVLYNNKFESFQFRFLSDIKMIIPYRVCILRSL